MVVFFSPDQYFLICCIHMIFLIRIYYYFLGTFLMEIMETKLGVCLIYL